MKTLFTRAGLVALVSCGTLMAETILPVLPRPSDNVVWHSPSVDARGSMPLGNGDVGINAWVEPSGDLLFYVSKTDAWDENGRLCKIGRVRVKFSPALLVTNGFRQELSLVEGRIEITTGNGLRLKLWVDANQPVVRLESESDAPVHCRAEVELWRLRERPFGRDEDSHSSAGLAASAFKPTVLPDVLVSTMDAGVVWYHRNTRSVYELGLKVQRLDPLIGSFPDPLLNRTFGASLRGTSMVADGRTALKSSTPSQRHALWVTVLTAQTEAPDAWVRELDRVEREETKVPLTEARGAHKAWWNEFWNRSWICITGGTALSIPVNPHPWRTGVDSDGGSRFGGQIASVRVQAGALAPSADRIALGKPSEPSAPLPTADVRFDHGLAVEAWVKPAVGEVGRIIDKCTAGQPDGITLDTFPGLSLRWIVGNHTMIQPNCLQPDQWQHVAATADLDSGVRRIYLNGKLVKEERADSAVETVTRGYILQRFMNACSGRGASPIKFNGSIFTVEPKPGASPETTEGNPDYRQWGGCYWFQNTRLAYWPMLATGDFDLMESWFRMYRDGLPLSQARILTYYGFTNAAQFPETMHWWGLPSNGDYGWENTAPEPANSYIRRYWNGSVELIAAMLDRYEFTEDLNFARTTLVPVADPLITFLSCYWKRDANGKIRLEPAQSLETWHVAVNPLPEIAGLRFVLPRLLALPDGVVTSDQRARWGKLLQELPPVPIEEEGGVKLLRPAESYSARANSENPELYAVFPYRLYGVGRPDLAVARATYERRGNRHNVGWCQDSIQAACLGLGDEAARLVAARASKSNPEHRFPAMWGPNFDWTPDQDHGNNILTTLQFMLLQSHGEEIYLLPAWPKDWDVSFKLHAPKNTIVEGVYRAGKLEKLKVTPESRRQNVVVSPLS